MELLTWARVNWDRALALVLVIAGAVILIIGWVGVSSTEFIAEQVPYALSAGLGGIVLVLTGCTLWVSAYLSDEWATLERIEGSEARVADLSARVDRLEREAATRPAAAGRTRSEITS